jgi:hypothetical protein
MCAISSVGDGYATLQHQKWLGDTIFGMIYQQPAGQSA